MLRLALVIWIALVGYKVYDYKMVESQVKETPPAAQESPAKTETLPSFDPEWEGHTIEKNKAQRIDSRMGKAVSIKSKSSLSRS